MNLLNFALGGLPGGLSGSPLTAVTGLPVALLLKSGSGSNVSAAPDRDSAMSGLSDSSSLINLLQQFAGSQTSGTSSDSSLYPQLTIPPLPQMPASKPAPPVPTDDHGQSNVVFSDGDSDSDSTVIQ